MPKTIFILFLALLFSVGHLSAMTVHVLWLTAQNDDDRLKEAQNIDLYYTGIGDVGNRVVEYQPVPGVRCVNYRFGPGKRGDLVGDYGGDSFVNASPLDKDSILRFIANELQVGSDDAVLVYYRGHGGQDKKAEEGEHSGRQYYSFKSDSGENQYLLHRDIRDTVEKRNPRLAVFIRDCCSLYVPMPTRGQYPGEFVTNEGDEYAPRPQAQELFISLFVKSRGVVDIASSMAGRAAAMMDIDFMSEDYLTWGTVFSNSFAEIFEKNRARSLTWSQFFGALSPACERRFSRYSRQVRPDERRLIGKHTPRAALLGGIYAEPNFESDLASSTIPSDHFGFEGEPVHGGVRLTRVDPEGRGHYSGFESGDIIYKVDDIFVTTNRELDSAIRVKGNDVRLKFSLINVNDGQILEFDFPDIRAAVIK